MNRKIASGLFYQQLDIYRRASATYRGARTAHRKLCIGR